jgi:hypothetical protein
MDCCYWWEDEPIRQFVLYANTFWWMDVWELKSDGIGSLSLKASLIWWAGIILAEGLHDLRRWAVSLFQLYSGTCLETEEEYEKPVRAAG